MSFKTCRLSEENLSLPPQGSILSSHREVTKQFTLQYNGGSGLCKAVIVKIPGEINCF